MPIHLDTTHEQLPAHEQFVPVDASPDARLLNIERQSNYDHQYFQMVSTALVNIQHVLAAHEEQHRTTTKANLDYRKEFFIVRDKLPDIKGMVEGFPAQVEVLTNNILVPMIDAKLQILSTAVDELRSHTTQAHDKYAAMEKYLEELHGERPREGARVLHTFMQMDSEITNAK